MQLVNNFKSYIDDRKGPRSLDAVVGECYGLGCFPALWAVEGVGKDLAEWRMNRGAENPSGMLICTDVASNDSQLMLHAGMGLGFAKFNIDRLEARPSDQQVQTAVIRTVDLCKQNSRVGYSGAAIESLGLASRFLRNREFCLRVHEVLVTHIPDAVHYFWRGVGRCLYFSPSNFVLGFKPTCRAIDLCTEEAPSPELQDTLLAGVAWALTLVNMRSPEIMEYVLENYTSYHCEKPGFFNGMMCAVVMRYDITPNDPLILQFRNHRPKSSNKHVDEMWRTKIQPTFDYALQVAHPVLKFHRRLDEAFRNQSLRDLIEQIQRA